MFDNIGLKIYPPPKGLVLPRLLENMYRRDENSYSGNIKNMKVVKNLDCIWICGSLPKFLQNENITPLSREKVRLGIKKLEKYTGLDLRDAVVCSVEFGTSIITKEKPFEYLSLFWHHKKLSRGEYSRRYELETITCTSKTGAFGFTAYDKIKEMKKEKEKIPRLFSDSNVLRLEYKVRKKRGIKTKFKKDLSAYDLFDEKVFQKFQNLFLEIYMGIEKMGRQVYVDKSEKLTPAKIEKILAEQYRQSFPKDYQYLIQYAKEAGQLNPRNLEEIRATERKNSRNVSISDTNHLIKELDAHVFDVMATVEKDALKRGII